MGFKVVKAKAIQCIKRNNVRHEQRDFDKNLFAIGDISPEEMVNILGSCRGDCYQTDKHHFLDLDVHIMKPKGKYDGLYIKFYFVEPDILFISVHNSNY